MSKLTQAAAVAMSTAASQVRPEWDHAGILHALRIEADRGTPCEDVFIGLANLCANPEARTPGLLNKPGSWWRKPAGRIERRGDNNVKCPEHPDHDMPHDHGGDMTPEQIAAKVAEAKAAAAANPYRPPAARLAQPQEEA